MTLEQDARVALLEHYISQLQGYKVSLLTIVIGFFAVVEPLRRLVSSALFSVFAGICVALIVYCVGKVFLYGQHVKAIIRNEPDCKQTMLKQLDEMVRNDPARGRMSKLCGCDRQLLLVCVLTVAVVSLIVYFAHPI